LCGNNSFKDNWEWIRQDHYKLNIGHLTQTWTKTDFLQTDKEFSPGDLVSLGMMHRTKWEVGFDEEQPSVCSIVPISLQVRSQTLDELGVHKIDK